MSKFVLKEWLSSPDIADKVGPHETKMLLQNEGIIDTAGEALAYLMGLIDGETR